MPAQRANEAPRLERILAAGAAAPPNKELKLTKPGRAGALQLNSGVRRTIARSRGRMTDMQLGNGITGLSQIWLARIGGALAMALILFLLLLRYYVTPDTSFGTWTLVLLLPAGFLVWVCLEWTTGPLIRRLSAMLIRMQEKPIEIARFHGVSLLLDQTSLLPVMAALPGIIAAPAPGLSAVVAYYVTLLLHECGHAFVAGRENCHVYTVEVHAFHGLTTFSDPWRHRSRILIAWGGVSMQMLVAGPAWACLWLLPPGASDSLRAALIVLGPVSSLWIAVNLVPIQGLDGELAWQLLRRRTGSANQVVQLRSPWRSWRERRRTRS
jgi:hypothetical protein